MNVYFDNAATTPLDEEVFQAMLPYLRQHYGNPSSAHVHGRKTRDAIEIARKNIANILKASPSEIFFTSGGTEADNTAIYSAIRGMGIKHAITSRLEHHAVLNTLQWLEKNGEIRLSYVSNDEKGNLDIQHLEDLLAANERSFVSIMHGNNEIGNLNEIELIGEVCRKYDAIFHTDTVQTMGHFTFDLTKLNVHFLVGSAHKFHGPKGIGFLYVRNSVKALPLVLGGSQERLLRAGTENVAGIVGLSKALEIADANIDAHKKHLDNLKRCCIDQLKNNFPEAKFNGNSGDTDKSLYTVLSVSFPSTIAPELLIGLDFNGISASGGSACNSHKGSHVLSALNCHSSRQVIRFSFSRYNTIEEIHFLIEKLTALNNRLAVA